MRLTRNMTLGLGALALVAAVVIIARLRNRHAAPPAPAACSVRASAFTRWTESVFDEASGPFLQQDLPLAQVPPRKEAPTRAPWVLITSSTVEVNGVKVGSFSDPTALEASLLESLHVQEENGRQAAELLLGDFSKPVLNLEILRDARWADVQRVLRVAARTSYRKAAFIFSRPPDFPPPTTLSRADQQLLKEFHDARDRSMSRGTATPAERWQQALHAVLTASCSAGGIFASYTQEISNGHLNQFNHIGYLQRRVEECDCNLDLDSLKTLLWHVAWDGWPSRVVFVGGTAQLAAEGEAAEEVSFPDSKRWEEIAAPFMEQLRRWNGHALRPGSGQVRKMSHACSGCDGPK